MKMTTSPISSKFSAREIAERDVEKYMAQRVRKIFGVRAIFRKVTWQGRRSAPDRVLMIPPTECSAAAQIWIELKRPGEKPTLAQIAEHGRMRDAGCTVRVVSSFADVDKIISDYM